MKKFSVSDLQNYIEENSRYCTLLKERFINEEKYVKNFAAIKQGLAFLGIPESHVTVFDNRTNLIIVVGRSTEYAGFELPLYIGHKKMGIPIPETIRKKCPAEITNLIENAKGQPYIQDLSQELKSASLTPDMFLCIHQAIMNARTETLLPDLLSDVERLGFTTIQDAIDKIPPVYMEYLSEPSRVKLVKKVSFLLREVLSKMEEELKNVGLYSLRIKEQLKELYLEADKGLQDIIEHDVEKGADINSITQKTANLFSRLDRLFLGNIYHLKDYEKRSGEIKDFLKQEQEFAFQAGTSVVEKRKKIDDVYAEFMFYNKIGPLNKDEDKLFIKSVTQEFEEIHRKKSSSVSLLKKFEKRGLLSIEVDADSLKEAYHSFIKQTLVPQYLGQCFLELVQCLPPAAGQPERVVIDMANLAVLALEGKGIMTVAKASRTYPEPIKRYIEAYRKTITILIYDIRGSSYMGIKLHNAAQEQRIKYKFAKEMADIVKTYGGFLLKDTGDGGLVWFAENSDSLYNHLYTESVTGRGKKLRYSIFSGAEFDIISAPDSAKRAMLCARDMVGRAEEFIRANFMHYREWFGELAERTLELDGVTYALLPPEFKSLFRIGIGIASGVPGKDIVFSANSYGDPDLVGPIISDAHLYSMERSPGHSVVICDLPSVINLIANSENFEYPTEERDFDDYLKSVSDIRLDTHGYAISDCKLSIVPKGIHYLEELNKSRALANIDNPEIWLDEQYLYDYEKKKMKLIYEIVTT